MSGQVKGTINKWNVKGNIAPEEVSNPSSVSVFSTENCQLSLESVINIDGHLIRPVKSIPNI